MKKSHFNFEHLPNQVLHWFLYSHGCPLSSPVPIFNLLWLQIQISKNLTCEDLFLWWTLVIGVLSPGRGKKKEFVDTKQTFFVLSKNFRNTLQTSKQWINLIEMIYKFYIKSQWESFCLMIPVNLINVFCYITF